MYGLNEENDKQTIENLPDIINAAAEESENKSKGTVWKKLSNLISKNKLAAALIVILLLICGVISYSILKNTCINTFKKTYEDIRQSTYNKYKDIAYEYYESKNHVSNQATISIGNIKEEHSLEVLSVSDSWIKISDPDNDADKTTRWVEFSAIGVYTIDISVSEFIIDNYNRFILVKLKTPQLSHIALDNNTKAYLYKYEKGFFELNGNYDSGVKMMLNDRAEALDKLTEQLESNDANLARAKSSAESLIRKFIKNVNPEMDLKDSNIQIEFI